MPSLVESPKLRDFKQQAAVLALQKVNGQPPEFTAIQKTKSTSARSADQARRTALAALLAKINDTVPDTAALHEISESGQGRNYHYGLGELPRQWIMDLRVHNLRRLRPTSSLSLRTIYVFS